MAVGTGSELRKIDRLLVANRGEIALRVMQTADVMGIETVAVHSDPDAMAPHVGFASRSVALNGQTAAETYLDIDKIIQAAMRTGAQAIHPGYGFLSENPAFARACREAGLLFVGPGEQSIEVMGNKAAAKSLMTDIGVPCIPGYLGDEQSDGAFESAAGSLGFPVMIKATAGGGGRGMRLVRDAGTLRGELALARSEAKNAFGSDELILEKAVENAHHVEMQILADDHGNCIHLGERDCSVQRRHQKIVEEAPCPFMTEDLRRRMGAAAVKAARSVDYTGAGTVEFLLDGEGNFYFLEMNTRLQVEHPVTEAVTGLDLVEWQIRIARGESLDMEQDDVRIYGHAIEVRLCAEDANFMPSTGVVHRWRPPLSPDCRTDSGIVEGFEISPYYDSLIAKIICHGPDRESARAELLSQLDETILLGPETNKPFLKKILMDPRFVEGNATTSLVEEIARNPAEILPDQRTVAIGALFDYLDRREQARNRAAMVSKQLLDWSSSPLPPTKIRLIQNGTGYEIAVSSKGGGRYDIETQGQCFSVRIEDDDYFIERLDVDGETYDIFCSYIDRSDIFFSFDGEDIRFSRASHKSLQTGSSVTDGVIRSPMHGTMTEISVREGDHVSKGQRLGVLEAMKMQHEIVAACDGIVQPITVTTGDRIAAGHILFEIMDNRTA